MGAVTQADQVQGFVKEAYGKGEGHDPQAEVGQDRHGAELEQTSQTHNQTRKHQRGGPHISPVQQIRHWREEETQCEGNIIEAYTETHKSDEYSQLLWS